MLMHSYTLAGVELSVQLLALRITNWDRLQRSRFTFCVLKLHIVGSLTVNRWNYFGHHRQKGCYFSVKGL